MKTMLAAILAIAGIVFAVPAATRAAPIERTINGYQVTFGYTEEPPYMEEITRLRVVVRDAAGQPVTGLEDDLKVHGHVQILDIERDFEITLLSFTDRPGVYEGVFVPPKPGDYEWRLAGTLGGSAFDERFTSGEGLLAPIAVRTDIEYGETGSIIATVILVAYGIGLAIMLAWLAWRRWGRRPHAVAEG